MNRLPHIVVLASGNGGNLQALIDACQSGHIKGLITHVVSNRASAYALERAKLAGIASTVISATGTAYHSDLHQLLLALKPDLIVLAGYMKIVKPDTVAAFRGKMLNLHPSLLPLYKGLDAIKQALDDGAVQTGCTVHYVDEGCDTGPVIAQTVVPIRADDSLASLTERVHEAEHELLVRVVGKLCVRCHPNE